MFVKTLNPAQSINLWVSWCPH